MASDDSKETPVNSKATTKKPYNHEIYLVEETKYLERVIVDTITFTNDLGRIYAEEP